MKKLGRKLHDKFSAATQQQGNKEQPNSEEPLLFQSPNYKDGKKQTLIDQYFKKKRLTR